MLELLVCTVSPPSRSLNPPGRIHKSHTLSNNYCLIYDHQVAKFNLRIVSRRLPTAISTLSNTQNTLN